MGPEKKRSVRTVFAFGKYWAPSTQERTECSYYRYSEKIFFLLKKVFAALFP